MINQFVQANVGYGGYQGPQTQSYFGGQQKTYSAADWIKKKPNPMAPKPQPMGMAALANWSGRQAMQQPQQPAMGEQGVQEAQIGPDGKPIWKDGMSPQQMRAQQTQQNLAMYNGGQHPLLRRPQQTQQYAGPTYGGAQTGLRGGGQVQQYNGDPVADQAFWGGQQPQMPPQQRPYRGPTYGGAAYGLR